MTDNMRSIRANKTKKKKRRKRIFTWLVLPLMILILSATAYATFIYKKAESVINDSYKPVKAETTREEKVDPTKDNISILLIGVDESKSRDFGEATRTDALMVATLNKKDKSIKLLSIPRDSYVHIPEKDIKTKINHAHAYGGVELTIETVQELLDIPIDYYMKMNFYAFMDVIDALDGIEVEVPYAISEQDSEDRPNAIKLRPGIQTLSGEEALALARTRHQDNDIERGKRQQQIMKAIFTKAISVNSFSKHGKVIEAIGENMTTNMTFGEMRSLINYGTAGTNLDIESLTLEGSDSMIDSVYYYQLDDTSLANIKNTLQQHLSPSLASETTTDSDSGTESSESDDLYSTDSDTEEKSYDNN